jgi:hypothetical protein
MDDVLFGRDTVGRAVAEVDLDETTLSVAEIVGYARQHGADVVWAHGGNPGDGFERNPGYAHLHADAAIAGDQLPEVPADQYGALLVKAYQGQWGHKWVEPTQQLPSDGSVVLCLEEDGEPIGLCRVWPGARLVDQPGVVPDRRSADHSLRLLGAACALLGPGPVDVDSWGESPDVLRSCERLGFAVTEEKAGWEYRL